MKVRTKLLSVLLIVSLFSPIVAYVALVGNPRISFALRMNESEAEQAVIAQSLRSDLMAIGSAMEESLAESYRIKAEGGDKEDARRQRTLANSAVLSEVAKYGTDLSTLAKLQKQ